MIMMTWLGMLILASGVTLLMIAAWGVLILPDALSRQHAATKAGTLALALVCLGAALLAQDWQWAWRLLLIVAFLLFTLPVSSHLLARAAIQTRATCNMPLSAQDNTSNSDTLTEAWQTAANAAALPQPACPGAKKQSGQP
ncbi:MAG: monovalent cation/H(+) antiporter subunit G [Thiolinea sp.]